ncbi:MAG: DUF4129 domain-containing transglutaminase family protein, partial [Leptolyngbyaceae bacterium]|nr:DUF4129 domain-containing transglutaminase family protein [Leptolyngbyaceae bacterium]
DRDRLQNGPTRYPQEIQTYYLQLPEGRDKIRQKTLEILDQSPNPLTNPYEKALYLGQYLKQNYTIQPDLPFLDPEEDLVESFLFNTLGGYPDHFSTALSVMLRSVGIPTRLVTGFAPGEFNPFTGFYIVRNTDAYALTDVYIPTYGWFTIDPIPGRELVPPSVEDYETFSVLQQIWKWVAGWLPSPITGLISGLFTLFTTTLGRIVGMVAALLAGDWVKFFVGLATLTGVAFGVWLVKSGWNAIAYRLWLAKLHPMEAIYQQMLRWLAQKGFRKSAAQTPSEYAEAMRDRHPTDKSEIIENISNAYVHWRYGNQAADIQTLEQQLKELKQTNLVGSTRKS